MSIGLNPYVNFRDTTREAMTFYETVFGGELTFMTYAEGGMPHDPAEADRIMHGQLNAPDGLTLMAADVPSSMPLTPGGAISIALSGTDADVLRGYWDKLSDGAEIQMPLEAAPWGDTFGACTDKYGVAWMFNIGSGDAE